MSDRKGKKQKRKVRRGLDSRENYGSNVVAFFYQIQGENCILPKLVSLGCQSSSTRLLFRRSLIQTPKHPCDCADVIANIWAY
jgi:hypothetical protein